MPLNIDFQQVLLHMLNSLVLFSVLYFVLYKPVKDFMAKREQHYREMDDAAKAKVADSEKLYADYRAKYDALSGDIAADRSRMMEEAEADRARTIDQAKKDAEQILDKARQQADMEKNRILAAVSDDARDIIADAARNILTCDPSQVYDEFLAAAKEQKL